jgi:hypothetical protein
MISVTSVTDNYILQPVLFQKHKATTDWLSAAILWKRELKFFQKILDQFAPRFTSEDDKKKVDHFQHIITYYNGELIDTYKSKLRNHEKHLAEMLEQKNEADTRYFKEHDGLMSEMEALNNQLNIYKEEFFLFLEPVLEF